MKPRSLLISMVVLSIASLPLGAIDASRPVTQRIGILKAAPERAAGMDRTIRKHLPHYLKQSLTEAGFDVIMIDRTIDEMTAGTDDDILIDIGFADADGESLGAVGAGGTIRGVGVGGEVSVIQASAYAEIRVYNARTLAPLTSLEMNGETTQPAFTAIGIGDPHGWIQFRIPIASKAPLKQAARNIASDVAAAISEGFR